MRRHHEDEEDKGDAHRTRSHQIGRGKREMLRQHATRKDADTQTEIPRGKVGGGSRATLGVGTQVDEQGVERREGCPEAQAATESNQQEGHRGVIGTQ